jgi:excisionase family DNA binding protein
MMDRKQAAEYLGVSCATLAQDVTTHRHRFPVAKVGRRCVYSRELLDRWLATRTVNVPQVPIHNADAAADRVCDGAGAMPASHRN